MTDVLLHTLVWTGALIALVLAVRRPVARWCGPEAAYALWAIPALRLLLPPITLPAWMAPTAPAPAPAALLADAPPPPDAAFWQTATPAAPGAVPAPLTVPMETAPSAGFDLFAMLGELPLLEIVIALWLLGAGVFLCQRFAAYFSLRDAMLAEGREVGCIRTGLAPVRLIETPGTQAPLAFGVLDPVIAMPPGFMALPDRRARDLALAHELAHHRGFDLVINVAVQPLFALHWWNPLGRYGWLALRRDQEAACDARVVARASADERAAYAALIASFAAARTAIAPNTALAAPMACPVLGETSILQRIRSLAVTPSSPRPRLMGRVLLGATVLALPLTASISYAASDAMVQVPEPPAPPVPPAPPSAPEAPQPPAPPEAPDAPGSRTTIIRIDPDEGSAAPTVVIRDRAGQDDDGEWTVDFGDSFDSSALDQDLRSADADMRAAREEMRASREEMRAALRRGLAEADRALAEMPETMALAMSEARKAQARMPRVMVRKGCRPGSDEPAETATRRDGVQVITICDARVQASARKGLEEARAEIARDKDMSDETRAMVLEQLDRQIARWSRTDG